MTESETKQLDVNGTTVTLSGPFGKAHYPYGSPVHGHRLWYVKWPVEGREYGECMELVNYNGQPDRYIIHHAWPPVEATTLDGIIEKAVAGDFTRCT